MLFNSVEFFIFFSIVYILYRLLPGLRAQNQLLLVASYIFYAWWDVRFLYLVVLSTGLDYCCGLILGTGEVPLRDRVKVSLCLIVAALIIMPTWGAIRFHHTSDLGLGSLFNTDDPAQLLGLITVDPIRLFSIEPLGWWVLGGTLGLLVLANLLYFPLIHLSPARRSHAGLLLTVAANLIFLGIFKYFNFFIESADQVLHLLGSSAKAWHLHIILPAGISFYTFQSLSYTIDVYKGRTPAIRKLEDYALFVMFFPVLVAGPIERAGHMMPKLMRPRTISIDQSTRGLFLILFGLMKKVAVADGIAPAVNSIYNATGNVSSADIAIATILFTFQIYCDFSGYTDIARGVGKLLGIDLLHNFNLPYFSRSPSEFWQRWHISLSTWLRDYLYIPLGGNRKSNGRTYLNLMITMMLGGLWHGAAWNYVLWGCYHGTILCGYRFVSFGKEATDTSKPKPQNRLASLASFGLFFVLTCYGWLLFRATSLHQILQYTTTLFVDFGNFATIVRKPTLAAEAGVAVLICFELMQYFAGSNTFYRAWPKPIRGLFYAIVTFILVMGFSNDTAQFIYFQF